MPIFAENAQLLRRFLAGEREALEQVYWFYVEKVERIARFGFSRAAGGLRVSGLRGGDSDIADLVQDVFLKAFAPAARTAHDGVRPYGPYLFAIARNVLVDRLRSAGREMPVSAEWLEQALEETGPAEPPDYAEASTMELVERFIRGLPEPLRGVHEKRYQAGLSQRDAAAALGLSRQTVRTLEGRLRSLLQEELRRAGLDRDRARSARPLRSEAP